MSLEDRHCAVVDENTAPLPVKCEVACDMSGDLSGGAWKSQEQVVGLEIRSPWSVPPASTSNRLRCVFSYQSANDRAQSRLQFTITKATAAWFHSPAKAVLAVWLFPPAKSPKEALMRAGVRIDLDVGK